jgi:putative DNA methylase
MINQTAKFTATFAAKFAGRPAIITQFFPSNPVHRDTLTEKKAGAGSTLTGLGNYYVGRKPLVYNQAVLWGMALPMLHDKPTPTEIQIYLGLCGFASKKNTDIVKHNSAAEHAHPSRIRGTKLLRAEEVDPKLLYHEAIQLANQYYQTTATTTQELHLQLCALTSKDPVVVDHFSGSGQIPFTASRIGAPVVATDISPIALGLTWLSTHIMTNTQAIADTNKLCDFINEQVADHMASLGFSDTKQHPTHGVLTAKNFVWCLEVLLETGWWVPLAPDFTVYKSRAKSKDTGRSHKIIVAVLKPKPDTKTFDLRIVENPSPEQITQASKGTIAKNKICYSLNDTVITQDLPAHTAWGATNIRPPATSPYRERLYAIRWETETGKTLVLAPDQTDLDYQNRLELFIQDKLADWQQAGWLPKQVIQDGLETTRLGRQRGWTHWHHCFSPYQLLVLGLYNQTIQTIRTNPRVKGLGLQTDLYVLEQACIGLLSGVVNYSAKLCVWNKGDCSNTNIFSNQALNPQYNWGERAAYYLQDTFGITPPKQPITTPGAVSMQQASATGSSLPIPTDFIITDPPYADAVNYEEIYEIFIAWLGNYNNKPLFGIPNIVMDSQRVLAIKGSGIDFVSQMIQSFSHARKHMSPRGIYALMFTHTDVAVWQQLGNILYTSQFVIQSMWYTGTETEGKLKGTKNVGGTNLFILTPVQPEDRIDMYPEDIQDAIEQLLETRIGELRSLNANHAVPFFHETDYNMLAYGLVLQVLCGVASIEGVSIQDSIDKWVLDCKLAERAVEKRAVVEGGKPSKPQKPADSLLAMWLDKGEILIDKFLVPQLIKKQPQGPAVWNKASRLEKYYGAVFCAQIEGNCTIDTYQNLAKKSSISGYNYFLDGGANNTRLLGFQMFKDRKRTGEKYALTQTESTEWHASMVCGLLNIGYKIYSTSITDYQIKQELQQLWEGLANIDDAKQQSAFWLRLWEDGYDRMLGGKDDKQTEFFEIERDIAKRLRGCL